MKLVYGQDERVSNWWHAQSGGVPSVRATILPSIAVEHDGRIVACVVFEGCERNNVYAHIHSTVPLPSLLLGATAKYAYHQLGVERMTFLVDEANEKCRRLVEDMGAQFEARLARAQGDRDTLVYVLWKDCELHRRLLNAGRM